MMFTTLITDLGAVLTYPQDDNWVRRMIGVLDVSVEIHLFKQIYTTCRTDYDAGLIDVNTYWQKVAKSLNRSLVSGQITKLVDYDIRSWFNINLEMLDFLRILKPSFMRLVLLSNINFECQAYFEKTYDWLDLFDIKVYSCHEKLVKPDKAIYELTLARAAATPGECIFIDDNPDNINSSRELGITGLLFKSVRDLKNQLRTLPDLAWNDFDKRLKEK